MPIGTKALVFALFCTGATLNPFLTLVLQDCNFTTGEIGTLFSLSKGFALVLTPLFCAVADARRCHALLLVLLSLSAAALMVSWWGFVPPHGRVGASPVPMRPTPFPVDDANAPLEDLAALIAAGAIDVEDLKGIASAGEPAASAEVVDGSVDAGVALGIGLDLAREFLRRLVSGANATRTAPVAPAVPPHVAGSVQWDYTAVLTVIILGVYTSIAGSNSVITDTLVLKQLEDAAGAKAKPQGPTAPSAASSREESSAASYPLQRLWGSISYGLTGSLTGMAVKLSGSIAAGQPHGTARTNPRPYLIVPLIHAAFLVLFACVVTRVTGASLRSTGQKELPAEGKLADSVALATSPLSTPPTPSVIGALPGMPTAAGADNLSVAGMRGVSKGTHARPSNRATTGLIARLRASVGGEELPDDASTQRRPRRAALRLWQRLRSLCQPSGSIRATVRIYAYLLRRPDFFFPLFCGVFFLTSGEMATWLFLFPYARRELHATPQLFSMIMLVHLTSEVAAFLVSAALLRRGRIFFILFVCALCYSLKLFMYSVITDGSWLLLVELLHGPCAAFKLTATVAHVRACASEAERYFDAARVLSPSSLQPADEALGGSQNVKSLTDSLARREMACLPPAARSGSWGTGSSATDGLPASLRSPVTAAPAVYGDALTSPTAAPITPQAPSSLAGQGTRKVELLSTALGIMWFAAIGLPTVVTGLLPVFLAAASPDVLTPAAGGRRVSLEPILFRTISVLLLAVAGLLIVYRRAGWFG